MGETVEFRSNGEDATGYLVSPPAKSGPGVVVIQEWWGVDPALKEMTDRLAGDGFVSLAPDLFRGELATHDEMDKATHLMQSLPPERAAQDMLGAVDYLMARDDVTGEGVGVVGFCMGGMLSLILAAKAGNKVKAVVPFYGFPSGDNEPDWSNLSASVRGHMAENDDFFGPDAARVLEKKLKDTGKDIEFTVHAGTSHAFMNPHNSLGTLDEEKVKEIWPKVISFLHEKLD